MYDLCQKIELCWTVDEVLAPTGDMIQYANKYVKDDTFELYGLHRLESTITVYRQITWGANRISTKYIIRALLNITI